MLKYLHILGFLFPAFISSAQCTFNSHLAYSDSCNLYNFEVANAADSCYELNTKIFKNGNSTPYTNTNDRNFNVTFNDTGYYTVRVSINDTCNNCDTLYYTQIHVGCLITSSSGCSWNGIGIYYSDSCGKVKFEMGSHDTCIKYLTVANKSGTSTIDTISDDRVFTHQFSSLGTWTIATIFKNNCTNCDTVIYKQLTLTCDSSSNACDWSNAGIYASKKGCKKYTFEMGSYIDSCTSYTTMVFKAGTNHVDTISHTRVFDYEFSSTGNYYVKTIFKNNCTNCDTFIYKQLEVTCDTTHSPCNWEKATIGFAKKGCKKYKFEMGSYIDSCILYTSIAIKSGTNQIDTISHNRVFDYEFSSTGNYYIKTIFYDSCNKCDTFIYKQIEVTCDTTTACDWSKANIGFAKKECKKYKFELGSNDTCMQYTTLVIKIGTSHVDTIGHNRVFDYEFADTGRYYIRSTFYNKCTNCDTVIYKLMEVYCDSSSTTSCDWSKVNIGFAKKGCKKYKFELGSNDTCMQYSTLVIKMGSSHFDTIGHNRVFDYEFADTGRYYIRSTFYNKCTNCDTVIYKLMEVYCDSSASVKDITQLDWIVFPNPANRELIVRQTGKIQPIEIYNYYGKLVRFSMGLTPIDISDLTNGVYFIKVGEETRKIEIQHR